jgi:hypothetical protein
MTKFVFYSFVKSSLAGIGAFLTGLGFSGSFFSSIGYSSMLFEIERALGLYDYAFFACLLAMWTRESSCLPTSLIDSVLFEV